MSLHVPLRYTVLWKHRALRFSALHVGMHEVLQPRIDHIDHTSVWTPAEAHPAQHSVSLSTKNVLDLPISHPVSHCCLSLQEWEFAKVSAHPFFNCNDCIV